MAGSLGALLASARKSRDVTQKQLADYLHVTQAMVSMFEGGELDSLSPALEARIRDWIKSGRGVTVSAPRGAYGR